MAILNKMQGKDCLRFQATNKFEQANEKLFTNFLENKKTFKCGQQIDLQTSIKVH